MTNDPKLGDEPARLAALYRYDILDSGPESAFDEISQLVRTVLRVPVAHITLMDSQRAWFKSMLGMEASEMPRKDTFCARQILQRDPMIINDATQDDRVRHLPSVTGDPHIRSYAGVPLQTPDGYNIGTLCAVDFAVRTFEDREIDLLVSFAKLVESQLQMRQIASSDALTGALTRRAWIEAAGKEIARNLRYGIDASIVVFDLDHFKQVNDLHGHAAGDLVLREVAARCFERLRDNDTLGRLGGEEFAVVLPSTGLPGALEVAERLRRGIAEHPFDLGKTSLDMTASFGVATHDGRMQAVEDWLIPADAFLYQAKHDGRNAVRGQRQIARAG